MSRTAHKLMASSGGKAYEIEQSLMLDAGDTPKLRRTPSSEGNRKTFTFSTWCKRASFGSHQYVMGAFVSVGSPDDSHYFAFGFNIQDEIAIGGWTQNFRYSNRKFRDAAAWYHLVLQVDTTQGTADNRMKIYVNGVQETSFHTNNNVSQNYDLAINNTVQHAISDTAYDQGTGPYHFDGYMAETHFFDGAVVAASEFGETDSVTGQWIPKEYTGTSSYGTNGYYMKYVSGAIGTDSSGQSNNYTTTNLGNGDILLDTPTNNFPIVNVLEPYNTTISDFRQGTLNIKAAAYNSGNYGNHFASFILPTSGKWYVEMLTGVQAGSGNVAQLGITKQGPSGIVIPNQAQLAVTFSSTTGLAFNTYANTADLYDGGSSLDQDTGLTATEYVCAMAIDIDNNKVWVGYNGGSSITWLNSGNPATGANGAAHTFDSNSGIYMAVAASSDNANRSYVIMNFGQNGTFSNYQTAGGNADGSGIGNFFYAPPTGFKALCTKNLPTPTIKKSSEHFNAVTYTGTGNTDLDITGVGFQPDLSWIKKRSGNDDHVLTDAVRGAGTILKPHDNSAEANWTDYVGPFLADGIRLNDVQQGDAVNQASQTYVMWNWKAGGSGSANTDGATNSVVSANTAAGLSIVTYTGTGSATTVGHGLGAVPEVVIVKNRTNNAGNSDAWGMYNKYSFSSGGTAATSSLYLMNSYAAYADSGAQWNSTAPTSSVFSVNTWGGVNGSSDTYVAYVFKEINGFSKFTSMYGNGSTNGPFIYTGFRPKFAIIKKFQTGDGTSWFMYDSARNPSNVITTTMWADVNNADTAHAEYYVDFLSNGIKIRGNNAGLNASGKYYIVLAWAELPVKYANAK